MCVCVCCVCVCVVCVCVCVCVKSGMHADVNVYVPASMVHGSKAFSGLKMHSPSSPLSKPVSYSSGLHVCTYMYVNV